MENKDSKKNEKKELYLQKRLVLSELSRDAEKLRTQKIKEAKSLGEALFWGKKTINYMLLNYMYQTNGATEFNTFKQWKEKGATILKGAKAFAIWGQPVHEQKKKEDKKEEETQEDKYKYFPICYLFSNLQVTTQQERQTQSENTEETRDVPEEKMEALII